MFGRGKGEALGHTFCMELTEEHYQKLLGLQSPWEVESVDLSIEDLQVRIVVVYQGEGGLCPECGKACSIYDHQAERTWRHLDTMQFETLLSSRTPRVRCPEHGVLNMQVPWAGKHSRFTLLFEAFVLKIMQVARSVEEVRKLLRLNWHQVDEIKRRAVERGLLRRQVNEIPWLGMDEKSFRRGQDYVSLVNDLEGGRVIEVVEGRSGDTAHRLLTEGLCEYQRKMVCGVAMDMSAPFINAVRALLPHADIVHDRFHVSQHLNEAVDQVRRQEHRQLLKERDKRLTGTKYLWLRSPERWTQENGVEFEALRYSGLNVAKAWGIKELFRYFWTRTDAFFAKRFFKRWLEEARKTALAPIRKVARMLEQHLPNLLTYFNSYITNAVSEGLNSKIQTIKANSRGFRSFKNYRYSILFYCGKLDMLPR